jgi:hypothetical protein
MESYWICELTMRKFVAVDTKGNQIFERILHWKALVVTAYNLARILNAQQIPVMSSFSVFPTKIPYNWDN